jgi:hypothetical protein
MTALTELEKTLLDACRIALRQLYASSENAPCCGAPAWKALTEAIEIAEKKGPLA